MACLGLVTVLGGIAGFVGRDFRAAVSPRASVGGLDTRRGRDTAGKTAADRDDDSTFTPPSDGNENKNTEDKSKANTVAVNSATALSLEDQLEALKLLNSKETITARDIGRKYLDAVVCIQTENGSGTGFFVGSTGYMLTSAHVVDAADSLDAVFHSKNGSGDFAPTTRSAKLIRIDNELDVALLKIETTNCVHVSFSPDDRVETGESVIVIGNPGLGDQILNRTMTEGIVSNPNRDIEGQSYIQISAAVNPGNSGGPLFNDRGAVIGLISLKGSIEGAGFALPGSALRSFLQKAIDGR